MNRSTLAAAVVAPCLLWFIPQQNTRAQLDAEARSDWADTYVQVALLQAAFDDCLRNSNWVGAPGVIPPACRSVADLKDSGFLARGYVVPTVCLDKLPTDRPAYVTWMFVDQRLCGQPAMDRSTVAPADLTFPVPMNGSLGDITWSSDLGALRVTVSKQLYIRTVGSELADGTHAETRGGYAIDENGTMYDIAWIYEMVCTPQCRPAGAQHAYFNVAQGHGYVFVIQGTGHSNNGRDIPTYTFQHH
jgi:hypothetical protein